RRHFREQGEERMKITRNVPEPPGAPASGGAVSHAVGDRQEFRALVKAVATPKRSLQPIGADEVAVDQYLAQTIARATEHIADRMGPVELAFIRAAPRDHLDTDPGLCACSSVQRAQCPPTFFDCSSISTLRTRI